MNGLTTFFCLFLLTQESAGNLQTLAAEAEEHLSAAQNHQQTHEYLKAIELFLLAAEELMKVAQHIHEDDPLYATKQADRFAQAFFAYEQAVFSYQRIYGEKPLESIYSQQAYSLRRQIIALIETVDQQDFVYHQLAPMLPFLEEEYQRLQAYEHAQQQKAIAHQKASDKQKQANLAYQLALQQSDKQTQTERKLKIGLWTSAGFALASLATGLTSSILTHKNSILSNYIVQGAQMEDFPSSNIQEICGAREQFTDRSVPFNCNTYVHLQRTSIAMWVMTGAFTASTAVLTGLLITSKKRHLASKHSKHQLQLGVAPIGVAQGAFIQGSVRF